MADPVYRADVGHRGNLARAGIVLLALILPGLGLLRLGRFKPAFGLMAAQGLTGWLLWLRFAYGPLFTFGAWLACITFCLIVLLVIYVASAAMSWCASRFLEPRTGWLWRWYGLLIVWIAMTLLTSPIGSFQTYYHNFYIPSESMLPGLRPGDRLIASMAQVTSLERGDVVIVRHGRDFWIRRVVGVPGDRFAMVDGRIILNGQVVTMQELQKTSVSYGDSTRSASLLTEQLPGEAHPHRILDMGMGKTLQDNVPSTLLGPDQYILLGDNRDDAMDSRVPTIDGGLGIVTRDQILGRALFRYWRQGDGLANGPL